MKEASGDISQITAIAEECPNLDIYCGNDDHVIPVMSVGGKGVISVSANIIPKDMHDLTQAALDGDWDKAKEIQLKSNVVNRAMFYETNPLPVKTAMKILNPATAEMRMPLEEMDEANEARLKDALKAYGVL